MRASFPRASGPRATFVRACVVACALATSCLAPAARADDGAAELVTIRQGSALLVMARNRYHGPVEVELSAASPVDSEPALPRRYELAAGASVELARLAPTATPDLRLRTVPGSAYAIADDVVYSLPVEESAYELGQGFHGGFSHADDANRYAVDLIVPEGTPVLAARDGTVMHATSGFREGGTDPGLTGRANLIRVLHDDGSMALYAHLQEGGVLVRGGERVTLGQHIGYSGSTGYSTGPHLHFSVQVNGGLQLVSVPFRMIGPHGYLPLQR
jgi:murein DD-endopeptidase MepM/ murein hydrolase activator NlpD